MNPVLRSLLLNPQGIVKSGLVAFYRFNEGAGQVLYDLGGNNANGQLGSTAGADTNDPTFDAEGATFSTDDYITLPVTKLPRGNSDLTMIVVCSSTSTAGQLPISYGSIGERLSPYIWLNTGNISFEPGGALKVTIAHTYANVGPMFLAFRYTTASRKLEGIINNFEKQGAVTLSGDASWGSTGAWIGSYFGTSNYLSGKVYFGLIYQRPLTDAEIKRNHAAIKKELAGRGVVLS